ncbi:unnamed protein product [Amoebophrya sp. A120]|nr:unnamed protein product [Amoebophrya sp. A120]|eukprot:GSA120T00011232001.1
MDFLNGHAAGWISKTLQNSVFQDLKSEEAKIENFLGLSKMETFSYFSELMAVSLETAVGLVPGLSQVLVPLFMKLLNGVLGDIFQERLSKKFDDIKTGLLNTVIELVLPEIVAKIAYELPSQIATMLGTAAKDLLNRAGKAASSVVEKGKNILLDSLIWRKAPAASEKQQDVKIVDGNEDQHLDAQLRGNDKDVDDVLIQFVRGSSGELEQRSVTILEDCEKLSMEEVLAKTTAPEAKAKLLRSRATGTGGLARYSLRRQNHIYKDEQEHGPDVEPEREAGNPKPHLRRSEAGDLKWRNGRLAGMAQALDNRVAAAGKMAQETFSVVTKTANRVVQEGIIVIRSGFNVMRDFKQKMVTTFKFSINTIIDKITDGMVKLFSMLFYPTFLFWIVHLVGDLVFAAFNIEVLTGEGVAVVLPAVLKTVLLTVGANKEIQRKVENQCAKVFKEIIPTVVQDLFADARRRVFYHNAMKQFIMGTHGLMSNFAAMANPLAKITATVKEKLMTKPLEELNNDRAYLRLFVDNEDKARQPGEAKPEGDSGTSNGETQTTTTEEETFVTGLTEEVKQKHAKVEKQQEQQDEHSDTPGARTADQNGGSVLETSEQQQNVPGFHLVDWTRNSRNDYDSSRRGAYFLLPRQDSPGTSARPPAMSMVQTKELQRLNHQEGGEDGSATAPSFIVDNVIKWVKVAAVGLIALLQKSPKFLKHVLADSVAKRVASMAQDFVSNVASMLGGLVLSIVSAAAALVLDEIPGGGVFLGLAMPGLRAKMQGVLLGKEDHPENTDGAETSSNFMQMLESLFNGSSTVEEETSPVVAPADEQLASGNEGQAASTSGHLPVLQKLLRDAIKAFLGVDDQETAANGDSSTVHLSEILEGAEVEGDHTRTQRGLVNYLQATSGDEAKLPVTDKMEDSPTGSTMTAGRGEASALSEDEAGANRNRPAGNELKLAAKKCQKHEKEEEKRRETNQEKLEPSEPPPSALPQAEDEVLSDDESDPGESSSTYLQSDSPTTSSSSSAKPSTTGEKDVSVAEEGQSAPESSKLKESAAKTPHSAGPQDEGTTLPVFEKADKLFETSVEKRGSIVSEIRDHVMGARDKAVAFLKNLGKKILEQLRSFLTQGLYAALVSAASHGISRLLVAAVLLVPGVRQTPIPTFLAGVLPALVWGFFKLDYVENTILDSVTGLVKQHVKFTDGVAPIVNYVQDRFGIFAKAAVEAIRTRLVGTSADESSASDTPAPAGEQGFQLSSWIANHWPC